MRASTSPKPSSRHAANRTTAPQTPTATVSKKSKNKTPAVSKTPTVPKKNASSRKKTTKKIALTITTNPLITSLVQKHPIQSPKTREPSIDLENHYHKHTSTTDPPHVQEQEENQIVTGCGSTYVETMEIEDEHEPYVFIRSLPPLTQSWISTRQILLPPQTRSSPKLTLVLDLDETLVHCSTTRMSVSDIEFKVEFAGEIYNVMGLLRPYYKEFLSRLSKKYEIVLFTASQKPYADTVCNILDPSKKFFKHRLFRGDCVFVGGNYIKDLSCLGRDLKRTIIVDNSVLAFGYHVENGIPIRSWYEDKNDTELYKLISLLERIADVDDVRPHLEKAYGLYQRIFNVSYTSTTINTTTTNAEEEGGEDMEI